MKKLSFLFLVLGFVGAGYYYGSQDDTYVYKFFLKSKNRFPANETAKEMQEIWSKTKLSVDDESGALVWVSDSGQDICERYRNVNSIKVNLISNVTVSDAAVSMTAEIDCEKRSYSPLFVKQFCSERVAYFKEMHTIGNTSFGFVNVLDGFPKTWYVAGANFTLKDGYSFGPLETSQQDVGPFGKYTIECSSL